MCIALNTIHTYIYIFDRLCIQSFTTEFNFKSASELLQRASMFHSFFAQNFPPAVKISAVSVSFELAKNYLKEKIMFCVLI